MGPFEVVHHFFRKPTCVTTDGKMIAAGTDQFWLSAYNPTPCNSFTFHVLCFADDRQEYYFVDSMLMPLFVQENYLHCTPGVAPGLDKNAQMISILESYSKAVRPILFRALQLRLSLHSSLKADCISESDAVANRLWSQQLFELMPLHATLSWWVVSFTSAY